MEAYFIQHILSLALLPKDIFHPHMHKYLFGNNETQEKLLF
jgi:hypothetical protein